MDPVGPWSAYAQYNRLTGVQAGTATGDIHHHLPAGGTAASPSTTTAQLLPGGLLSPPPVGYEVFSPFFHHPNAKPGAHYVTQVTQHRQVLAQATAAAAAKQSGDGPGEYHQAQAFFDQSSGAWQQNSPFGILPHESVTPTSTTPGNFNAHFAAAQGLNHLNPAGSKNPSTRAQSPQVSKTSAQQTGAGPFFQVPTTFASSDSSATNKSFSSQQSCIVSSPSNTPVSKDYRVPQVPARAVFLTSVTPARSSVTTAKQTVASSQIQTKAQTKIYPELSSQNERRQQAQAEENQNQSSPVSFSVVDAAGRIGYAGNNLPPGKRQPFPHANYRHYQSGGGSNEQEFQRPKSGSDYPSANGPDCNVVVPRRPSPLQAHSQPSPLGHVPSPAYPMYNSPMNSIASPQQATNQLTPPSPVDVSVPRPNSQTGNVAYPSVITRALNAEKTFSERYERSNQSNQQTCWEERANQQQQQRKFQPANTPNSYSAGNGIERNANDRQSTYFEANHQVTLQDLSSCRGDPMSIVKNLQQQQSCQIQASDIKQEVKPPVKRRKSNEKPTEPVVVPEYFSGRIPPPAHSSAANQQPQNGAAYFDFDRWNLPPPAAKMFASQAMHQQHQGLMVPHPHGHHPGHPIPYFTPFLTPHPTEFSSGVELTPYNDHHNNPHHQQQASQYSQPVEEQPKVVVPNIEEELNFLSTVPNVHSMRTSTSVSQVAKPIPKQSKVVDNAPGTPQSGFMSSYLKFLQGERDSSPPPVPRGSRKQNWARTKPSSSESKTNETNGVSQTPPSQSSSSSSSRLSQGDPQDDPRYFPLPKERKKNCFDSSDDGLSSEEDLFKKVVKPEPPPKEKIVRKGRPPKPGGYTERRRASKAARLKERSEKGEKIKLQPFDEKELPRRELAKRAAKEKVSMQQLMSKNAGVDDDLEEPPEFQDSDSDPAWTPQTKEDLEEDIMMKKGKRRKKGSRNLITAAAKGAGIDGYISDSIPPYPKKQKTEKKHSLKQKQTSAAPTLEDNIAAAVAQQNSIHPPNNLGEDNPYKNGEFLVIKSELNQEWPGIWRVDGRSLLQKYEPFEQNGKILYRNVSSFTSWTLESKKHYVPVPVRYRSQGHLETVVEFLRSEVMVIDNEFLNKVMKSSERYQDNFEVYIQTLISQALDSNFLTEIFQERDEYFLTNVKTIDDVTNNKRQVILKMLNWPGAVQKAVGTWPCFNVMCEVNATDAQVKACRACTKIGVDVRVLFYGQPYNSTTLEGCQPDPKVISEKDFLMCRMCASRVELFNKITHQKYLMYIECAKRVAEKRTANPEKDTTCILNELLADEKWLNLLFTEVRNSWAEVDSLEHSYQLTKKVRN